MIKYKIIYQDEEGNDIFARDLYFLSEQEAHDYAQDYVDNAESEVKQYHIVELGWHPLC